MVDVAALFKQYYPRLRNYAFRFLGDEAVADDIVQECFIRLYEKRFSLEEVSPGALLYVMVRNSCLNYLRRRLHTESGLPVHIPADLTPEDHLLYEDLRNEIKKAMRKLPPRCREVFYMSRFEGLSTREIADRIGSSCQNVEKHIARALAIFTRHFAGLDISRLELV